MFDGEKLGAEIALATKAAIERATAPLLAKIAELESRTANAPDLALFEATIGERIEVAVKGLTVTHVMSAEQMEEQNALLAGLVERAVAALPPPKDGEPGRDAEPLTEEQRQADLAAYFERNPPPAGPPGRDGADGKDGRDGQGINDIDVTHNGDVAVLSVTVGDKVSSFEIELPQGDPGRDGKDGKLPLVKAWSDQVHYEGDVVTYEGGSYQALRDTGKAPGCEDWACLAAPGAAGRDAREITVRSTWSPDETYPALAIVVLNGSAFISRHDDPGPCPGDGWQLLAGRGKSGPPGQSIKGDPGPAGPPGPSIIAASVDGEGVVSLVNADGTTLELDLYPVLTKLVR